MWPAISVLLLIALVGLHLGWTRRHSRLRQELEQQKKSRNELEQLNKAASHLKRTQQDAMFNSMAEGVLLLNGDGRILWLNRSLQRMFNLDDHAQGRTVAETFNLPELVDVLSLVKKNRNVEGHKLHLNGKENRVVQVNAATVGDETSKEAGSILVFHELTRIKELENTRQEFVANVSHELRTPLALIKGYVETLLDTANDDPEQTVRFLQIIDKHTDRLTFLIDDLLTISRLESGQAIMNRQHVVLHEAAQAVVTELLSRADLVQVKVENVIPVDLVSRADAERLHQVFFNLIENAIKYGKTNGRVTLGGQTTRDGKIEIWVRDDGPGIPPELRERVFERFYRVDKARSRETGGTGLGLSIVKHIVQAHGGEVWVRSEKNQGTTFCFTLPGHA